MKKAIFLDRDGVINRSPEHPEITDRKGKICKDALSLEEYKGCIYPNVKDSIQNLKNAGYEIVIISNQGAIAKGFYPETLLEEIKDHLKEELGLEHQYYCVHHPEYTGDCECRKPKPGLILKAAEDLDIDLNESYMIGDNISDVEAGEAAGCKTIKIEPGHLEDAIKIIIREA